MQKAASELRFKQLFFCLKVEKTDFKSVYSSRNDLKCLV